MNISIRVFFGLLLLLPMVCFVSCGDTVSNESTSKVHELQPLEFFEKFKSMPQSILIDLRPNKQVSEGALWGSINKSYLDPHFEEFLRALDPAIPLMIYSEKGVQSARVAKLLNKRGFREIYLLSGGYQAWQAAGF